jgi:hypothetical protein
MNASTGEQSSLDSISTNAYPDYGVLDCGEGHVTPALSGVASLE